MSKVRHVVAYRSGTAPKIQVGGVRHPQKVKGKYQTSANKGVWKSPVSRQLLNALKDA